MQRHDPNPYPGYRYQSRHWIETHTVPKCECGAPLLFEDGNLVCSNEHCTHKPKGKSRYDILRDQTNG